MNDLKIFSGLYGEMTQSSLVEYVHIEPLEARSKRYNWEIEEHLHIDLVQIFIINEGYGKLKSEKSEWKIAGPTLIWMPNNTLHGFSFQDGIKGTVITFAASILENTLKSLQKVYFELSSLHFIDFRTKETDFKSINLYKTLLGNELSEDSVEKKAYLNILFQALFMLIYRNALGQQTKEQADNKTLGYFQKFQKNIKTQHLNSVGSHAKMLGISTMHLNRVCKAVLGKSPIEIMHEYQIMEAKKYLLNTSYSISEISYLLNFNDPAYFTRLFKKHVGVSPKDFKKA